VAQSLCCNRLFVFLAGRMPGIGDYRDEPEDIPICRFSKF
jgi:hypothetical protein